MPDNSVFAPLLVEIIGTMIGALLAYLVVVWWDLIRGALAVLLGGLGAVSLTGLAWSGNDYGDAWIFAAAMLALGAMLWFAPTKQAKD
jgi:hypothetical protein